MTAGLIIGGILGLIFAFTVLENIFQKGMKKAPSFNDNPVASYAAEQGFSMLWGIFLLVVFVAGSLTIGHLFLDCLYCEPMTFDDKLDFVVRAWTENPAMFLEGLIPCE